ncbi:AP-3 complex subunit sigma isoform B [Glycine soja]|uniref:AP-3 complex subunit sigma isoform B n=1 Tax=Glycine soja TaxID=3848 RepID=A0A445GIE6_GLYSO|nr:AP-3 complex subunit sigma isoform B [Glycine soja]
MLPHSLLPRSLLPHSLHRWHSSVRSASPFFVSLPSIRFSEGESTGVQRCGGYWWHTRYTFVLGVRSGVPQMNENQWIYKSIMSEEVNMNYENEEECDVNVPHVDCSEAFNTSQVFDSRGDVLRWAQSIAYENGFVAVIVRFDTYRERSKMIKAVLVLNTEGKPRLAKFYQFQISLWRSSMKLFAMCFQVYLTLIDLFFLFAFLLSFLVNIVSFAVLCCRPEHVSNFVDAESFFGPDSRLVYKHFATLYFMFIFDSSENELAMLDLIQGRLWYYLTIYCIV